MGPDWRQCIETVEDTSMHLTSHNTHYVGRWSVRPFKPLHIAADTASMKVTSGAALRFILIAVLLSVPGWAAAGAERVAKVLRDQREHGYVSASAAISQLREASDAEGPNLPLQVREAYHYTLLRLAMDASDFDGMQERIDVLDRMSRDEGCTSCKVHALLGRAYLAMRQQSLDRARPFLDQAEALLPQVQSPGAHQQLLALRGNIEGQNRKLGRGIELTMQALRMAEAQDNPAEAVRMLGALIWMNTDLGDLERAAAVGEDAYKHAVAMNYRPMMARISLDLGHTYSLLGKRELQREVNERALQLSADDPGLINIQSLSLNNLADFHLSQPGQEARALDYARRAESLARQRQSAIHRAAPLTNMGIALARMGAVDEGVARIREAVAIAEKMQVQEYVAGITRELVTVLEGAGRYQAALAESHKANALQAKLTQEQREKAVLELQEKYDAERRTREIERLSTQNSLTQAKLEANAWRQRLGIVLVVVLTLGSGLLLLAMHRIRKVNRLLAEQSQVDPLTGAFNRRHALALLSRRRASPAARRAQDAADAHTGLMMLDLDFFKRINDTAGHAAGDAVLVETTRRLRTMLRDTDTIARWGGEEFVLILPGAGADHLPSIARKVLDAISKTPMDIADGTIAVTASAGAISYPAEPLQDIEAALALADLALYRAKADGRNRAVCITRVAPEATPCLPAGDLAEARDAGDVDWVVVNGC